MSPSDDDIAREIRESLADPERFTLDDIRRDLENRSGLDNETGRQRPDTSAPSKIPGDLA